MKLRVLIVDDESLSRERLRHFLRAEPQLEIVAECAGGREAVKAIREQSPDIVFLDVKMPELDGFRVLECVRGLRRLAIIFVTAHDQFAVRAFEVQAVDYLLKPFDRERLQMALSRARDQLQRTSPPGASPLWNLLAGIASRPKPLERLMVKSGARIRPVNVAEIDWVSSADNYVELHVGNASHLLRGTISTLADQLPKNQFARISRSVLVNADRIKEIRSKSHGDYEVLLRNGTSLPGTRNYRRSLESLLSRSR